MAKAKYVFRPFEEKDYGNVLEILKQSSSKNDRVRMSSLMEGLDHIFVVLDNNAVVVAFAVMAIHQIAFTGLCGILEKIIFDKTIDKYAQIDLKRRFAKWLIYKQAKSQRVARLYVNPELLRSFKNRKTMIANGKVNMVMLQFD